LDVGAAILSDHGDKAERRRAMFYDRVKIEAGLASIREARFGLLQFVPSDALPAEILEAVSTGESNPADPGRALPEQETL
jgi:hypothetical protein